MSGWARKNAPVERPQPKRGVLERRRVAAELVEPRLDRLCVVARLAEVVGVDVRERLAACELRAALEESDRLLLDRVRVREVLAELFLEVVAADCLE